LKNLNQIPVCQLGYAITRLELMEPKRLPENILIWSNHGIEILADSNFGTRLKGIIELEMHRK
jgi:hypothetical protein